MEVIVAAKAGFCFGVKRAVEEAIKVKHDFNHKIYTLGPLIHNKDVVEYLKENDIYPIELEDISSLTENDAVIIRSHGVTPQVLKQLKDKGIKVIDTTCPYVSNIQRKVKDYYNDGYSIVIVGDKDHPEVIGINGWCENKAQIAKSGDELKNLPRKVCVVSQTTEKQQNWESVLMHIVKSSKEIVAFNTICNATEVRQKTAEELSKNVDAMIVLGGYNSSNTTKLYEICMSNCSETIHVEKWDQIPENFLSGKNINKIGVTAGASTPDWIIEEAVLKMSEQKEMEMNEQLAFMEQNKSTVSVGRIVKGTIISVNDREAYVNIGYKSDGYLPKEEVTKDENAKLTNILKVGDEVNAKVISRSNEDGYVVLSRTEIEREEARRQISTVFENNDTIEVVVKEAVAGGLVASYRGVRIFIPASHVELFHVGSLDQYVGKKFEVKIIEFKDERRGTKIVASRRELLKSEKSKVEEIAWSSLEQGQKVVGEVKRLTSFGAFVDVNGVDGLLHVSEMSWGRVTKPSDILKVGDKIEVYLLEADKENKKLSLSIKKLTENPWTNVDVKYPVGNIVLGKVVRFASFGAFVELEPGVDALVHISQISNKRIANPGEVLTIGQSVKAKIVEVDKEAKKIGLSIKEVEEI
jgi:(E)-4-hydroxy-3-methyl-but-2-enyl pyrophosphate reductase